MYKEKYLKYKTKYLELKNQLGGNSDSNIIQDGGSPPWWESLFGSPNKQKVEDEKPIAPQTQSIQEQLENGILLLIDYIRNDNSLPETIIIKPTIEFYRNNFTLSYLKKKEESNTENTFIILKNFSGKKIKEDSYFVVGLKINYLEQQIYVIEWNHYSKKFDYWSIEYIIEKLRNEILMSIIDKKKLDPKFNKNIIETLYNEIMSKIDKKTLDPKFNKYKEIILECLENSITHLKDKDKPKMIEYINEQIKKINHIFKLL